MEDTNRSESTEARAADRRVHDRVQGPFDGRRVAALETPVRISNLSEGGCFVDSKYEQVRGTELVLAIDLPEEGPVTVEGETLYHRRDYGFAVRFTDMTEYARSRLQRALEKMRRLRKPRGQSL